MRRLKTIAAVGAILNLALFLAHPVRAGIFDDFNDGDATDGAPLIWDPIVPEFPGDYDAASGDFVMTPPLSGSPQQFVVAMARGVTAEDVSIRAQVRKIQANPIVEEYIDILARLDPLDPSRTVGEYSVYDALLRYDGTLRIDRFTNNQRTTLASVHVPYDVTQQDVVMQFDLFGNTLSLWAWLPEESMPPTPQLTVTDLSFASGGIAIGSSDGPGDSVGIFRWVYISPDHSIRDGDATDDGRIDIDDLNAVRNNFGAVGLADGSLAGDTVPFDGKVNIDDLNAVRNNFGASVINVAPEPGGGVMLIGVVACWAVARRRTRSAGRATRQADSRGIG